MYAMLAVQGGKRREWERVEAEYFFRAQVIDTSGIHEGGSASEGRLLDDLKTVVSNIVNGMGSSKRGNLKGNGSKCRE